MSDVVVDASVWVSRFVAGDSQHGRCQAWFAAQATTGGRLIAPALVLAEIAGAIRRRTGQAALAHTAISLIQRLPAIRLVPIDARLAGTAATLAAEHGLRGADSFYAATALELGLSLITLDKEQLKLSRAVISVGVP